MCCHSSILLKRLRCASYEQNMSVKHIQVEADQGRTEVKSWPCPESVRGGDATQFKPGLTADDRLTVWVGDIYQSADLIVNSSTGLHGVKLLRYWLVSLNLQESCTRP